MFHRIGKFQQLLKYIVTVKYSPVKAESAKRLQPNPHQPEGPGRA
jgi:hypothetical protein